LLLPKTSKIKFDSTVINTGQDDLEDDTEGTVERMMDDDDARRRDEGEMKQHAYNGKEEKEKQTKDLDRHTKADAGSDTLMSSFGVNPADYILDVTNLLHRLNEEGIEQLLAREREGVMDGDDDDDDVDDSMKTFILTAATKQSAIRQWSTVSIRLWWTRPLSHRLSIPISIYILFIFDPSSSHRHRFVTPSNPCKLVAPPIITHHQKHQASPSTGTKTATFSISNPKTAESASTIFFTMCSTWCLNTGPSQPS
jgi:hypothetical protein